MIPAVNSTIQTEHGPARVLASGGGQVLARAGAFSRWYGWRRGAWRLRP